VSEHSLVNWFLYAIGVVLAGLGASVIFGYGVAILVVAAGFFVAAFISATLHATGAYR
jgi:hypothetical protein